jgi:hypothetical protein
MTETLCGRRPDSVIWTGLAGLVRIARTRAADAWVLGRCLRRGRTGVALRQGSQVAGFPQRRTGIIASRRVRRRLASRGAGQGACMSAPYSITRAEPSFDDQLRSRRKRYMIMMVMRVPFLVVAALLYQTPWLALLMIGISVPLPWIAVLIANDRPARKRRPMIATVNSERALPPGRREIVDGLPHDTEPPHRAPHT